MLDIPAMTHPLSRYWEQPSRDSIVIDESHALMEQHALDRLSDYSASVPSGVYEGKMWKRSDRQGGWLLCWYGPSDKPNECSINYRQVLLP